ncbi:hypothetical protein CC1G_05653 [Coprinopsis cinerea okayama7|uniref:Uncharacterized protein n=1 Tax=Coprinopsis cinerea (strain Okayama-7 / 130 / ATCC MYA-4618 / FGSC 9003) TaxID=240176 RepID=A8P1T4_COPC7|nr:hypothetical protein CC1G_05653 [Coprinopsis cinerea okayama7\|eukprot:XP_001838172.1 hypothetical protein CC1G_05653 [Coprinopsis cinerea okayama7\
MFDNTLKEEDEEEESRSAALDEPEPTSSPGLTNRSSAPSDEGTSYPITPPDPAYNNNLPTKGKPLAGWDDTESPYHTGSSSEPGVGIAFPSTNYNDIPIPPRPTTPKKLRKKGKDGYDSDGGYLSEGGKKAQKKEEKARLKEEKREQKEEDRKRKKSFGQVIRGSKKAEDASGYDTDGAGVASSSKSPFKSKSKKPKSKNASTDTGAGYETDAGYASAGSGLKKGKSRFFKISLKGSRPDLKSDASEPLPPPLPTEPVTLPIAERFATSLGALMPGSPSTKLSNPELPAPSVPSTTSSSKVELPSIQPSEPLDFDSMPSTTPTPSTPKPPVDRSSLSSGESSSSQRPRIPLLFREVNAGSGHRGAGAGSISTINSTQASSIHSGTSHQQPVSPITSTKSGRPSSSSSGPTTGSLKATPTISYPITRAASPAPPTSPTSSMDVGKNNSSAIENGYSRGPSPLPTSPSSPYVVVTPSMTSSPVYPNGNNTLSPPAVTTPLSPPVRDHVPVRPRNPPTDGFGPRSNLTSPPPNHGRLSPNPEMRSRRLSPLLVPQDVSSKGNTPLPSPNVLAYYDIPPPSPPPMGPLPSVPPGAGATPSNPPPSHLRSKLVGQRNGNELSVSINPNIQRGRESPFPSRPIASPALSPSPRVMSPAPGYGPGVGLEARPRPRFREMMHEAPSSAPLASRFPTERNIIPPRANIIPPTRPPRTDDDEIAGLAYADHEDEDDQEDMRDVLDRFHDSSLEGSEESHYPDERTLPSRRSFEALRDKHESFAVSEYYGGRARGAPEPQPEDDDVDLALALTSGNRDTLYTMEDDDYDDRSIYSRVSILDPDKSGETRDRFVRRVEAMLRAKEAREGAPVVPPVPKIPEGLANASRPNRF